MLMAAAFIFSVVLTIISFIFLDPLCRFLGSDDGLLHYCREYLIPVLISLPFAVFGMVFRLSFITVGKAGLRAFLSVIGGIINIVLDWLFMGVLGWGLAGAAIATGIGYSVPSVAGMRTCLHKRMRTSFRQILPKTALKILAGRQARLRIFALS